MRRASARRCASDRSRASAIARLATRRRTRAIFTALLLAVALAGCARMRIGPPPFQKTVDLGGGVKLVPLTEGVWRHVTVSDREDSMGAEANGLLIHTVDGWILVDTGWNLGEGDRILKWALQWSPRKVAAVIVTHAHPDRTGGVEAATLRQIPVIGHTKTGDLAEKMGIPGPSSVFQIERTLRFGGAEVTAFYPGPGHAPDNVVVWVAGPKILFGGCLVRSANAINLGWTQDADLAEWPRAIQRVEVRFPDAEIVVPGHGDPGGTELLAHTRELLEQ